MDAVERLVALQEIRDLIARYAIHYDDKDWDAFAKLWAEDAAFVANGIAFEGEKPMLEFLTTCLPDDYSGKHMNSPPLIEIGPDGDDRRRSHGRRVDRAELREPDRGALPRHLRQARRPVALPAPRRGGGRVHSRRPAHVRRCHGGEQLDDAEVARLLAAGRFSSKSYRIPRPSSARRGGGRDRRETELRGRVTAIGAEVAVTGSETSVLVRVTRLAKAFGADAGAPRRVVRAAGRRGARARRRERLAARARWSRS